MKVWKVEELDESGEPIPPPFFIIANDSGTVISQERFDKYGKAHAEKMRLELEAQEAIRPLRRDRS